MFKGEYNHTIDDKGRIIVPVKYRDELGDGFTITKGLDKCLWIFDKDQWKLVEEQANKLPMALKEARIVQRYIIAGAFDGETDKQGRMVIPASLRTYAGITKEVVLAGVGNRIEVWAKDKYEEATNFEDVDILSDKLIELGFTL